MAASWPPVGLDLDGLADHARCDLLIVGAGPAGLAAAVYGASEGLDVVIVEDVASAVGEGSVVVSAVHAHLARPPSA